MKKRTKITIAASLAGVVLVGAAAAVAGPIIYRDLIATEPDAVPTISTAPDRVDETAAFDPSGTWSVAEGSTAGYRVDEVLNGTDITVTGRTSDVTGSVLVDGRTLSEAEITVDVATITTDQPARDDYFRQSALKTDQFPTATFTLTEPITAEASASVGDVVDVQATGDLTIAGVTQSVTFDMQAVLVDGQAQIAGSIPITFADFGVEAPNLGFVSVEPEGAVEFQLVLTHN